MSETYRVSGKKFTLTSTQSKVEFSVRPGGWVIAQMPDGSRRRFALTEGRGNLSVSLGGKLFFGTVSSDRSSGRGSASGSDSDLVAQFPGKVRKILVAQGAQVKEGEALVLVEAMKMEFTVKAPFDGLVSRLCVQEGQQLSPGDRLIEMEASASEVSS